MFYLKRIKLKVCASCINEWDNDDVPLQKNNTEMTYREYLQAYRFREIWKRIVEIYGEGEGLEPVYHKLYKSVKSLPDSSSAETIVVCVGDKGFVEVKNCLDVQENMVDREVEVRDDNYYFDDEPKNALPEGAAVAAHLLYWCSMYGFQTERQRRREWSVWIRSLHKGTIHETKSEEEIDSLIGDSIARKRLRFWHCAVLADSTWNWECDLAILRHKLAYKIGYWKYVKRHVCWERDVKRMELTCGLIDTLYKHDYLPPGYVNDRNADRYGIDVTEYGDDEDMIEHQRKELRKAKAYSILWRFLDHNMRKWWD